MTEQTGSKYRKGGVGAMMDEYERAIGELMAVFEKVGAQDYEKILDPNTNDENCRSVQTILSHVVSSGYTYAAYLRKAFQMNSLRPAKRRLAHSEVNAAMKSMIDYTIETLQDRWEIPEEEILAVRIESNWGQTYDLEQILEHAIVHALRHRRQIEKFISISP